jgi:6-phospho-beta-glucosidase
VDVRNGDTLVGMAADDVVEVPARVTRTGAEPLPQEPLAPELLGLAQHTAAYERLAVTAARSRDETDVKKALLAHPLIGQYAIAETLLEQMTAEVLA